MDLYHAEIGLPNGFVKPTGRVMLCWTHHADNARRNDRYGDIPRFKSATLDRLKVIEVGMNGNNVAKILFRGRLNDNLDVCMVLIPDNSIFRGPWTVKTVWINERNDVHKTLDRTKYINPER